LAHLNRQKIQREAKRLLASASEGMRWTSLVKNIHEAHPETPINSIWGGTQALFKKDADVIKLSKGIYALQSASDIGIKPKQDDQELTGDNASQTLKEADFYDSFADWLRDGLDEVTNAITVGGNIFGGKWNTPDVIGVLRPLAGDLVKFDPQVVTAEIKIDPNQSVTAFGQAISYRLFSHKSYLVLPNNMSDPDFDRVMALATVFGLGLITFDLNKDNPAYKLEQRASLAQPDMSYVNQMAAKLNQYDSKAFDKLF
jgi:hypothetical protein